MSGISLPTFQFTHVDIDAGSTANTSYIQINVPAVPGVWWNPLYSIPNPGFDDKAPLIYGDFSVESVIIGDSITATGPSLGKFVSRNFFLAVDYIRISGH